MLLVTLASLALIGAATLVSMLDLDGESSLLGWTAATLDAGGMILAAPGGANSLDLAASFGMIVFAGVGWTPRRREALLLASSLGFVVGLLGSFFALAPVPPPQADHVPLVHGDLLLRRLTRGG